MTQNLANFQVRDAIKNLLKRHQATYADLGKALNLSEPTIKQMMSKGQFTLDRLALIAGFFSLSMSEFFEIAFKGESSSHTLTHAQEEILAKSPLAMLILFQLSAGFNFSDVKKRLELNNKDWEKALFSLDRAGLIELQTSGVPRLKFRGPYFWNINGVLEKAVYTDYLNSIVHEISSRPHEDTLQSTFELFMTNKLARQFRQDIRDLIHRYFHLSRLEGAHVSSEKRTAYSAMMFLKEFEVWAPLLKKKAGLKR